MTTPLERLVAAAAAGADQRPPTSRYHGVPTARHELPDGRTVLYLRRRFLPPVAPPAGEHVVVEGERLDHLAHRHLGDAEQWWRVAEANPCMDARELTAEPGRRVALPEGSRV